MYIQKKNSSFLLSLFFPVLSENKFQEQGQISIV